MENTTRTAILALLILTLSALLILTLSGCNQYAHMVWGQNGTLYVARHRQGLLGTWATRIDACVPRGPTALVCTIAVNEP